MRGGAWSVDLFQVGIKKRKQEEKKKKKKISFLWSFIPIPRVRLPVITTLDFFCRVFFCEKKNERRRYHLSLFLSPSLSLVLYILSLSRYNQSLCPVDVVQSL